MNFCFVTSNIRFDNPADGVNAWPHRRIHLASTLLAHKPDIIATQEGRFTQLKDFESLLPHFQIIDQHRSWIKERMYPSFFIRRERFEVIKSGDLWLSETPGVAGSKSFQSAFPRLMTWVRLQVKESEQNLLIVNTHLDHIKEETRIHQVEVLVQEIKRIWKGECPLFIMGDFNDSPDGKVRSLINQELPGLQDAWKVCHHPEETSHHAFNGECQNGSRIDWILLDKKTEVESCVMEKKKMEDRYPSDHFPIICRFKL